MKLSERDVAAQIVTWLCVRGWIPYRKNVGVLRDGERVTRFGKPGECDWLFVRPRSHPCGFAACEIEVKAPGKKPTQLQREYIATRNRLGIPATWVDSVTALQEWFGEQGLND